MTAAYIIYTIIVGYAGTGVDDPNQDDKLEAKFEVFAGELAKNKPQNSKDALYYDKKKDLLMKIGHPLGLRKSLKKVVKADENESLEKAIREVFHKDCIQ